MSRFLFTDIFPDNTPIELMINHMEKIYEVRNILEDLIKKYISKEDTNELVEFILKKENEADKIKIKFLKLMGADYKLTFSKKSLIHYIQAQDSIINMFKDIARKITLNNIADILDDYIRDQFLQLVYKVCNSIDFLYKAVNELENVMLSSFSEEERKKEEEDIENVEKLENEIDMLTLNIGKWIYSKKYELNPIDLIYFRELTMLFSKIGNIAEEITDLIRVFSK